jgi:hypothetical protein
MSNDTTTSKRPTHKAYSVRKYQQNGEHKSEWTPIGVYPFRGGVERRSPSVRIRRA